MKVLITGGAGFIGSHTADALLREGHSVRVLDTLEPPVHPRREKPAYLDPRTEFVLGDVRDADAMLAALQGVDAVYHLAAFQDYLPTFSRFFDVNVTSTALLYEIIVREQLPIRKVIVASSQAALGEGAYRDAAARICTPDQRPEEQLARGVFDVQPPPDFEGPLHWMPTSERVSNPQNSYGMSKIAEERAALYLGKRYDIPSVAMRYSIVQGPRQSFYNAYSGACRVFSLSFHQGREPSIYEDGRQVRDFVNVHDVVAANLLVLRDERADYEMFNVGGGRAITVSEFAFTVADVFGFSEYEPQACGKYRFGDTRHIVSDVSKLESLGWKATRSTHESVSAYKDWLASAEDVGAILDHANQQMTALGVVREVQG